MKPLVHKGVMRQKSMSAPIKSNGFEKLQDFGCRIRATMGYSQQIYLKVMNDQRGKLREFEIRSVVLRFEESGKMPFAVFVFL